MSKDAAELADMRRRFPCVFVVSPWRRAARALGLTLAAIWLITLCVWFDITAARLGRGLSGLLVILRQMVPPSPGAQWVDILHGLADRLQSSSAQQRRTPSRPR